MRDEPDEPGVPDEPDVPDDESRAAVLVTVDTAATTRPVRSRIGAATELDPAVISSDMCTTP